MPREAISQRSGVSYAPQSAPFQSGIRVPLAAGVDQKAASLQQALGIIAPVAQKLYDNTEDLRAKEGAADAARGEVDQTKLKNSQAYEKAAVQTQTAASFVQAEGEFRDWYDKNFDKSRGTPQDLSNALDQFLQERYGHVNDKLTAEVLVPRMADLRARLLKEQQENVTNAVKADQVAAVSTLIRDSVNKGQPVDIEAMKAQLLPMFSKGEAAENLTNIIGTMAVEAGDPSMIDKLVPEKWTDGTPGPRSTPKLANALNQYRAFAESAARQASQDARALANQKNEQTQVTVMQLAAKGDFDGARKQLETIASTLSAADYRAVHSFIRGEQNDSHEQDFDPSAYINWRMNMYENPEQYASPSYIVQNVGRLFPNTPQRFSQVAQAMDDVITAKKATRSLETNPTAKAYRTALTTQHKLDALSSEADKTLYAAGMLAFDKTFVATSDPEKANDAAKLVFDKKEELTKTAPTSIADDVKALAGNKINANAFRSKYASASDAVDQIRQSLKDNKITQEQAIAAARALQ